MTTLSLQDRVKALNLGMAIAADVTGQVTVTGGDQRFTFANVTEASEALDLAGYVAFNTLVKVGKKL